MNRPPLVTYAIGNPLTLVAVVVFGVTVLYECWNGQMPWLAGVAAAMGMSWSCQASEQLHAYRQWKRSWDSMDARQPAPRLFFKAGMAILLAALLVAAFYAWQSLPADATVLAGAVAALAAGVVISALLLSSRRRRAKRHAAQDVVVSVCVRGPLIEVPPLSVALHRLPVYCLTAMNGPSQSKGFSNDVGEALLRSVNTPTPPLKH